MENRWLLDLRSSGVLCLWLADVPGPVLYFHKSYLSRYNMLLEVSKEEKAALDKREPLRRSLFCLRVW